MQEYSEWVTGMHEKSVELLNKAVADELSAVHHIIYDFIFLMDVT